MLIILVQHLVKKYAIGSDYYITKEARTMLKKWNVHGGTIALSTNSGQPAFRKQSRHDLHRTNRPEIGIGAIALSAAAVKFVITSPLAPYHILAKSALPAPAPV